MKTYLVAVVYTGKSQAFIPSRWYKVKAMRKSTAEKRAILKARAEFPRYLKFAAVADTLTARKRKSLRVAIRTARYDAERLTHNLKCDKWYLERLMKNRHSPLITKTEWARDYQRAQAYVVKDNARIDNHEAYYLQLLELQDAING